MSMLFNCTDGFIRQHLSAACATGPAEALLAGLRKLDWYEEIRERRDGVSSVDDLEQGDLLPVSEYRSATTKPI